jgi:hypothetical protein
MPTTRSAARQPRREDSTKGASGKAASTSAKRKAPPEADREPMAGNKKPRRKDKAANGEREDEKAHEKGSESESIIVNRAPVLQLWGAVVAKSIYPDLSWATCLSIGEAISSLCAVAKGRSVGLIKPPDPTKTEDSATKKRQKQVDGSRVVKVMGFSLRVKDDAVLVGGKPKRLKEENLVHKFGGEQQYSAVKSAFEVSLQTWSSHEDELNSKAFHMYEQFRPNVPPGQKGWGRKGVLNIADIARVVRR